MRRIAVLAVLLLTQAGCLRAFTDRLDRANEHLEFIRGELKTGNAQLAASGEQLRRMEQHMEDMRQKMATMERFMKRFGGRADGGAEAAPVPTVAEERPGPAAP
jgi:septal ring factor EnvC (AmiA/AmiB activator)